MSDNPFRLLPSVNQVLDSTSIRDLNGHHARENIVYAIRSELDALRNRLRQGEIYDESMTLEAVAQRVISRIEKDAELHLRSVINATGIPLHTNLGRSPLAEEAAQAAYEAATCYLNLEMDLVSGKRSSRQNPIREVMCQLTGAESATAVNNCAAATVITLRTLAQGKEVIVSRGQLIEIGGSFRIPEIMEVSGAILKEVGTTNITRISDYEKAITSNTALLMRIHPSNYRVRGFTEEASLEELIALGKKYNLPVIDDVGSGVMIDVTSLGFEGEPVVPQSITQGADLVLFSGDKLLGGPQAGIIVGKKALIDRIEKDPIMRAIRLDKMTLAALEATLKLYRNPDRAIGAIPTLRMMRMTKEEIRPRCQVIVDLLRSASGLRRVEIQEEVTFIGGGSLPDQSIPTLVVAAVPEKMSAAEFAERLRLGDPPVVARIQNDQVLFHLRTVFESQESTLIDAICQALSPNSPLGKLRMEEHYYTDLAAAFVKGKFPEVTETDPTKLMEFGRESGLRLHKFKRTLELPRVRKVLGILRGIGPLNLLDIGSGRGVFLWPLLDTFRDLPITAVDRSPQRISDLTAVCWGGIHQLTPFEGDVTRLIFEDQTFDVTTVLEVLEHLAEPHLGAREVLRVTKRFVVASVPSKPDDNPEHLQLFDQESITALFEEAARELDLKIQVKCDYVLSHLITVVKLVR